jgi:hypothetical protein
VCSIAGSCLELDDQLSLLAAAEAVLEATANAVALCPVYGQDR